MNTALNTAPRHPVLQVKPLGFPWETVDPFLFCAYHDDAYPPGNGELGPAVGLVGRDLGQDFSRKDGWSMYHGSTVPGFPPHPHRGFETVTVVRQGLVDHCDSLGAAARFGAGDVQWLTAGRGIVHSEMFPLLNEAAPNPLELFQIWLNLPARHKMVAPHFTMFWSQHIPRLRATDAQGRVTEVSVVAGCLQPSPGAVTGAGTQSTVQALAPPPDSWASQDEADVAIWTLRMAPGAHWQLPAASGHGTRRHVYFFKGETVSVAGQSVRGPCALELDAAQTVALVNTGCEVAEFLLLQGKPLAEPVVQHGPFVMNTTEQIKQALQDYRRTQFGGWDFALTAPVHGKTPERFALHPGGRRERPDGLPTVRVDGQANASANGQAEPSADRPDDVPGP